MKCDICSVTSFETVDLYLMNCKSQRTLSESKCASLEYNFTLLLIDFYNAKNEGLSKTPAVDSPAKTNAFIFRIKLSTEKEYSFREYMRVYPKVSGLAAWSENCKWYS